MQRRLPAGFLEAYRPRTNAAFLAASYSCWVSALLTAALLVGFQETTATVTAVLCAVFGTLALGTRWHLVCRGPAAAYRSAPLRARLVNRGEGRATVLLRSKEKTQIVGALDWLFDREHSAGPDVWVCVSESGDGIIVPPPQASADVQLTA